MTGPQADRDTVFESHGHTIDLERLYAAMYEQAGIDKDGARVFHGNSPEVKAMKRLLNELFEVPVTDKKDAVNNAIRSEARDRLAKLGWASKDDGRSGRYVLHRRL